MSEEKKTAVTEEVKETRKLTEEELAQVSGGVRRSEEFPTITVIKDSVK